MADMNDFKEYTPSEEDIQKIIRYLKTVDPKHATREDAIEFLDYYRVKIHVLSHHLNEDQMIELYNEFAKKRDDKTD